MMDAPAPPPDVEATRDPRRALRGLFGVIIETLQTRLDLAAVELEMHLRALLRLLVWAAGAVLCALLGLAFGVTAIVMAMWNTHRMLALLGGFVVFVGLAVLFGYLGMRTLRLQPGVLEGSLEQLQEDTRRAQGPAP
ncbi:MAG TPA: phage holin family protein [Steroidobacteraceae bacterium]|nr:phage holin family protein [Steroidobacteraceae bacterium]